MISLGICDYRYAESAERVVQHEPLTCPPALETEYLLSHWGPAYFVYVDLHGRRDRPFKLYADGEAVAHVNQFWCLPGGKVTFFTTCDMPHLRFVDAMKHNWLVMGDGKNYGLRGRATGAPLMALWMRRFLERGFTPRAAFLASKARVFLTSWRKGDRDALAFQLVAPQGVTQSSLRKG